jgi:Transposase DDE domain
MPVAGGGFEQCYNAQAVVAAESLLVITADVVQAPNDKQQIAPMLEKTAALPDQLGRIETLLADNGYFSAANVLACAAANIAPLIATGRQGHHPSWRERFAATPPAPENPTPVEAMAWQLRKPSGQAALRLAQADPGTGVRYYQIGDGIPSVPVARSRSRSRRMEPRHHELEHQEDVCAQPRLSAFASSPASRQRCWKPPAAKCRKAAAAMDTSERVDIGGARAGRPSISPPAYFRIVARCVER